MSYSDAIGGYFGLEPTGEHGHNIHEKSILLNSARNCLEYVLRARRPERVYMPSYTCSVVFEPLDRLNIPYSIYELDKNLEFLELPKINENELLLYSNYFGLKDAYCDRMVQFYGERLVLDCSQALYYAPQPGCHVFYSPRKFVGLPDGGCLYTPNVLEVDLPVDTSSETRTTHLYIRDKDGAEAGYNDFLRNDASLSGLPIMKMSELTKSMIGSIAFDKVRERRKQNFAYLFERLGGGLLIGKDDWQDAACPMVFPYLANGPELRGKLIAERIYTATYWPNVLNDARRDTYEYNLANRLMALPIDQRYNEEDMQRIVEVVDESSYTAA